MSNKPLLLIQLRPENVTSDNEYHFVISRGGLNNKNEIRLRAEQRAYWVLSWNNTQQ